MKIVAMIPARYAASRFPAKLLQKLGDKTVIRWTYENTVSTNLFDDVFVVTDSEEIYDEITNHGGKALMSKSQHESGSDRIAEAAIAIDVDVIINVQGDEPFVKREPLEKLIKIFEDDIEQKIQVGSLMQILTNEHQIADTNFVKVAVDKNMNALFFSRSVIPYNRDGKIKPTYYEHIGVYAFRKQALIKFTKWGITPLESVEKIECLRYLENSVSIKMVVTEYMGIEIDTPEDLIKAAALLNNQS
jgi:3-deoxy-D-manno-octulosonate cytidylyltransferase